MGKAVNPALLLTICWWLQRLFAQLELQPVLEKAVVATVSYNMVTYLILLNHALFALKKIWKLQLVQNAMVR